MMKFDPSKLAKDAMQGLQQAEKHSDAAAAAKNLLHGVKEAATGKVPEQMLEALRKLLEEAKRLAGSSADKNEALETCIQKTQELLKGETISTELVAKATAELGALLKGAGSKQPSSTKETGAAPKTTPKAEAERKAPAQPTPAQAAPAKAVQFSDVEAGAYYYDAVQWAVQNGIASGTSETTFSPDQSCTRAQTISFIWRAEGSPAPKSQDNPFTDVAEGAFYYPAALWAAERGIVVGTTFHPDEAVTRGQLSTFLYRNAGSPAVSGNTDFTDVPGDAYFAQAVAWVAKQGITSGTGDHTFSPDTVCTRGQIVTFLYRAKS